MSKPLLKKTSMLEAVSKYIEEDGASLAGITNNTQAITDSIKDNADVINAMPNNLSQKTEIKKQEVLGAEDIPRPLKFLPGVESCRPKVEGEILNGVYDVVQTKKGTVLVDKEGRKDKYVYPKKDGLTVTLTPEMRDRLEAESFLRKKSGYPYAKGSIVMEALVYYFGELDKARR